MLPKSRDGLYNGETKVSTESVDIEEYRRLSKVFAG